MHQRVTIPYHLGIIFSLLLVNYEVIIYLSSDAYLPSLPEIAHEYSASPQLVQLTITTWFMGSASLQLFLGLFSEWTGRRPILLLGGLIFIIITFCCAICQNIYILLVLRFIQGAVISSVAVVGYATIHEIFDRTQAIHVLAIMCGFMILAPAFGPLLGATILYYANWRWIFLLLASWAVLAVIGLYFYMPETVINKYKKINFRKGLIQYKSILKNKKYILLLLTSRCLFGAMITWIYASPFLLIERFGFSTFIYAAIQVLIFGSFTVSTRLLKILMARMEVKIIVVAGVFMSIISSFCAAISSYMFSENVWSLVICILPLTIGSGMAFPVLNRLTMETGNETMASKTAMSSFITCIFGIAVSGIISVIYDNSLFTLSLILILFSSLGGVILVKSRNYLL